MAQEDVAKGIEIQDLARILARKDFSGLNLHEVLDFANFFGILPVSWFETLLEF